jgi:O-antigen biosynthesis protein WbqP
MFEGFSPSGGYAGNTPGQVALRQRGGSYPSTVRRVRFRAKLKRGVDIVAAGMALLVTAPLLLTIWLLVKSTSRGPGIFWSRRIGRHGTIFEMPKFRTMTSSSIILSREIATAQDIEVTALGAFLRKTSLDELPQLWSVLRGQMSLIGPRPLLVSDIANAERAKFPVIYSVRPGMSGLAQVKGRNSVPPRRKARYDAFYARELSLRHDLRILQKTVIILFNPRIIR